MEISLNKDDDLSIVTLRGKGVHQDGTKLRDYLDLLFQNDALFLVVDLTPADDLPASILGILTKKGEELVERGGKIMFVVDEARSFSPLVSVAHMKKFFPTATSVEEASSRIRIETVERESLQALIRRARPTPPALDSSSVEEGTRGRKDPTEQP